uniref:Uncharacterized protein n=1 Tax=Strigamia maritima TaxID=126957 RepID=T1IJ42_STRMM
MYGHVDLHPSQQISDPPIIKRNLVRNIVAQFNEEAMKRNKIKNKKTTFFSDENLHYNSRVPVLSDPDDDTGPNNNVPFSYTSTLPFKSKSEYNLKSPNEVIYAQVVVNGQGGRGGKSTIHTKVPVQQQNGITNKYNTIYSNGMSKNYSTSMGNLQSNRYSTPRNKLNVSAHDVNHIKDPIRPTSRKYITNDYQYTERSRSESPNIADSNKQSKSKSRRFHFGPKRHQTKQEEIVIEKKHVKESKKKGDKERIRSKSEDNRLTTSRPNEPSPDYNHNNGWNNKIEYRDETSDFKREIKEGPTGKMYRIHEPAPDYEEKRGYDEVDREMVQNKEIVDTSTHSTKEGQRFVENGVKKEVIKGNTSNVKTTQQITQEKVVTRKLRSSSEGKKSSKEEKVKKEKDKSKMKSEKKSKNELVSHHESKSERGISEHDGADKKFYYFGANEEIIRPARKKEKEKEKIVKTGKTVTGLSSTQLVKEANAQVSGQEKYAVSGSKWKSSDLRQVSESPTGSANQDSGYFSRGGMSPTSKDKLSSPEPFKERIINVQVEGRKGHRYHKTSNHREEHISNGYFHDAEERMETSESDDIPNHWVAGGSRDSQVSAPSNQWSSLEEDEEDIVAAHVNTPQSLIREMGKREISYENSQRPREKDAEVIWFDKSNIDSDYRREMSTGCFPGGTEPLQNDNHINNNWGGSATLSRLETNKNRMNNDTTMRSATVDRRQWNSSANNENSSAVKTLLNGRDVTDSDTSTRHGILSKTGNYASETESQHSRGSKGSRKSGGSGSPALKRVNFKTRSKSKRSASSAANLSPMHREAMLRAGSPVRPPSANSIHSSGSDGSNRSVILHAPTVADIPPPPSYR